MSRALITRLDRLEAAAPKGRIVGRTFMPPMAGKAVPDGVTFTGLGIGSVREYRYSTEAALRTWLEKNPPIDGEKDIIYSIAQCAEVLKKLEAEI